MSGNAKAAKKSNRPGPTERQLGALKLRRISVPELKQRFLPYGLADGMRLFFTRNYFEIDEVVERIRELGLSDLLEPVTKPNADDGGRWDYWWNLAQKDTESSDRICAALGAKAASIETFDEDAPSEWHQFGKAEADAWFLSLFAFFYRRQAAADAETAERLKWAQALGSLMQWRRFWDGSHDLAAVLYHTRFSPEAPGRRGPRAPKRRAAQRKAQVVKLACQLLNMGHGRKPDGTINARGLAKRCESMSAKLGDRVGFEAARKIIDQARADGELV